MQLSMILLVLLPVLGQGKDTHFDIFIFTQHWPFTTCLDWEERSANNKCQNMDRPSWSVHGLWPTQFGKIAPGFCNSTWKFEYSAVQSIRKELDVYWPDVEIRNHPNSLWTHEWEKHGTCAAQLEAFNSEVKYFQAGIDLAKRFPLTKWLEAKSLVPGDRYTKEQFYKVVQENTKMRPHIDCEMMDGEQYIKEIKICLSKTLEVVDCDNIVLSSRNHNSTGSCRDNVKFAYPDTAAKLAVSSGHLTIGLVLGLGGAALVLIAMIVLYLKTNRPRRGYESI